MSRVTPAYVYYLHLTRKSPDGKMPSHPEHLHISDALPLLVTFTLLKGQEFEKTHCQGKVGRKQAYLYA